MNVSCMFCMLQALITLSGECCQDWSVGNWGGCDLFDSDSNPNFIAYDRNGNPIQGYPGALDGEGCACDETGLCDVKDQACTVNDNRYHLKSKSHSGSYIPSYTTR